MLYESIIKNRNIHWLFTYILLIFLFLIQLFLPIRSTADTDFTNAGTKVNVNGSRLYFDVPVLSKNQRTFVPLRGVFEKLGAQVEWVGSEKKIIVTYRDLIITLWQNKKQAIINGVVKDMDVAPGVYEDRTMIPLRFIAENMGMSVQWIPESKIATVTDPLYFRNLPAKTVLGFMTRNYPGDNLSYQSLMQYNNHINNIATFSYLIDGDGNISMIGQAQDDSVKFSNLNGIKPLVLVHNCNAGGFDSKLAHAVLSVESKRKNLIDKLFSVVCSQEYSGVNIDIEAVPWADRQYYSAFVRELKARFAPYGFLATVSIPAKTYDAYAGNSWSGAFEYAEIGKYADRILLMTYDEHYINGKAGPIASVPWVVNVLRYAAANIPQSKILMGIGGYGYDWSPTGNKTIIYKKTDNMLKSLNIDSTWDEASKSPHFSYTKDGIAHEVWYENNQSLIQKIALAVKYNLGGVGIWRLGFDNDDFWAAFNTYN